MQQRHVRATEHRHSGKIETVERFAGWQAGLEQMSLDASLIAFGELRARIASWSIIPPG